MFTGIVKGRGIVRKIEKLSGLHKISIELPKGAETGVELGASIAIDGTCLTVASISKNEVTFDVMLETLDKTTLGTLKIGEEVNIERAAKDGAEIGGHPISGHIDTTVEVIKIDTPDNNYVLTFKVPKEWMQYIFSKGYVALNGASLTIVDANREDCTFKVWLIPETLRLTTFGLKKVGSRINLEVERSTQVIVDTVINYLDQNFKLALPDIKKLLLK